LQCHCSDTNHIGSGSECTFPVFTLLGPRKGWYRCHISEQSHRVLFPKGELYFIKQPMCFRQNEDGAKLLHRSHGNDSGMQYELL
jgi:hypothetical protein